MQGRRTGKLEIVQAINRLTKTLKPHKLRASDGTSFRELEKLIGEIGKEKLTSQFSVNFFELHQANAFWICHRIKKSDKPISIQAFRLENLKDRSLSEHWSDQQTRIYPKPNLIGSNHAPLANRISGRVVYTGEFWIAPQYRRSNIASTIAMKGILICLLQFDPDWLYGFMSEKLALRGFASSCGFDYLQPTGTHWVKTPNGVDNSDWLIASDRQCLQHRADIIAGKNSKLR